MPFVLAADVGTTQTKAALVDERGRVVSFAQAENRIMRPSPGAAEHNPESLYRGLCALVRKVARGHAGRVGAFVLSGYQLSLLALDRRGRPLTGLMTLLDIRPQSTFPEFARRADFKRLYRSTGCPPFALYPLSRLFWLKRARPGIFGRIGLILGGKDYLILRLTGRAATEASLSSATQMLDIRKRDWSRYALGLAGLDSRRLPAVVPAGRPVGGLTAEAANLLGLRREVKVVPGVYDAAALVLGVGGLKKGVAAVNLGTTAMLRAVSSRPVLDDIRRMSLQTYCLDAGSWLAGAGINNAGNVRDWMVRSLGFGRASRLDALARRAPRGADGLFFLPYLTGDRDPRIGGMAAGAVVGLREGHGPGHLAIAMLEGVSYAVRLVRDTLAERGVRIREIRTGGGGARSKLWLGILSDVMNLPVAAPGTGQPALTGSAMLGFTALGVYGSLREAGERMVRVGPRIKPNPARAARYEVGMKRYTELLFRLFSGKRISP